jgi:RNA recognition motif-containing protein
MFQDESLNHSYKEDGGNMNKNYDNRRRPPREQVPVPDVPPFTAFIGNLSFDVTEENLIEYFGELGVLSVRLMKKDGISKGYGYIEFEDKTGLQNALLSSGQNFYGRMLKLDVAKPPREKSDRYDSNWSGGGGGGRSYQNNRNSYTGPPSNFNNQKNEDYNSPTEKVPVPDGPPYTAFIGNLSFEVTEDNLLEYFGELGVLSVRIMKDNYKSKGYGYIEFSSEKGLQDALLSNGQEFYGRMLKLDVAKKQTPREKSDRYDSNWSGGGGGGRGYQNNRNSYTGPSNYRPTGGYQQDRNRRPPPTSPRGGGDNTYNNDRTASSWRKPKTAPVRKDEKPQ